MAKQKPRQIKTSERPSLRATGPKPVPDRGKRLPPFPVVALGASAGGLHAFRAFFQALPADTGMAFVLIQHMDPGHVSQLAEILERETVLPVTQAVDGVEVQPNCVYVIPPGMTMEIADRALRLSPRAGLAQHRPVDHF